jgi:ApaG protein
MPLAGLWLYSFSAPPARAPTAGGHSAAGNLGGARAVADCGGCMVDESFAETRGIEVAVRVDYVRERSQPLQNRWYFTYRIRISNRGSERVKLLNRHWVITDASGRVEEVRGPGVVGEQPELAPGQTFEYTSFCPLPTPFGTMEGSYEMVTENGEKFHAKIAKFTLSEPMAVN